MNKENTQKRTWLRNEYDCGCQVIADSTGACFITYCPLHKAAPAMYEALKEIQKWDAPCTRLVSFEKALSLVEGKDDG